jgi:probable HAF family extracellular repeat protein
MKHWAQNGLKALTSAWVWALLATVAWSQSITWLGVLPGGGWSRAYGVSADGTVVVGEAINAAGQRRAFRWENGVMQDLGTLGGNRSEASAVSAGGAVVVGGSYNAAGQARAFRWENGVMQDLGTLGGGWSEAYGVSADGSVVVGRAYNAAGQLRAFRWTENDGMQNLGTLGGNRSDAFGVSADGSVVVGWAYNAAGQLRAFRWTENDGMQNLGTLPGGDASVARGVSANGAVVVGWTYYYVADSEVGYYERAFRWTENDGMQNLGTLGSGYYSYSLAYGVSADGAVVVGFSDGRPFRWTVGGGMEDLNTTYASLLTNGSRLAWASAISPDGRYIVGWGYNAATQRGEAYLLDTGFPRRGDVDRNGCVDDADLLAVLSAFGERGYRNEDLNWDGVIDDADLLIVLFNFGSGC